MELKGKKIIFLGDSITEGVGASATDKRYTDLVAQKTGATVYNHGIGGTRIAKQKTPSYNPVWDKDFCSRAKDMEKGCRCYCCFRRYKRLWPRRCRAWSISRPH